VVRRGVLPRLGSSKLVTNWIIVTLSVSIVGWLDGRFAAWVALMPSRIVQGEVWRLFTWPFAQPGPMSLVLTCAAIFKFGGELAVRWGDRRLQRYATELLLAAGAITCLLALVAGQRFLIRTGGWAVTDILVIGWARQFPSATLVLYGMLELQGKRLVQITVGVSILFALSYGPVVMAPELSACALAALYHRRDRLTR
jgi:membrane associated rhomboid family serine protease